MIAIVAPGQGAQSPGMLAPWLELPGVAEQVAHYGDLVRLDLVNLGTTGSAEDVTNTAVTQPLLAALALVTADQLGLLGGGPADVVVAGHSIGELPAAAVVGALTADDAMSFSGVRGAAMAAACAVAPSTMAAVLGGDADDVVTAIEKAGAVAANRNGAGQIVAAGSREAIDALVADPPPGARVRPLAVAGAFHSEFMALAEAQVREWVDGGGVTAADPRRTMLSNADGEVVSDGRDLLQRLIGQLTRSVRWDLCMETMTDLGVDTMIELAPGGTLTGIAKRAMSGVELVPIKSPTDLDRARSLLASGAAA